MIDAPRLTRKTPAAKIGIVHLGPGAFFRAFNAVYTHEAMEQAGGDWGILAVSLRSPTAKDQLGPQEGVYTAVTLGGDGRQPAVINSISDVMVAPDDPGAVVAAMADPSVKIVSLTITEKGYCHSPATGSLDLSHPDIQQDLTSLDTPKTAIGFIVSALQKRRMAGAPAFTVLTCDNLPGNGALVSRIVSDFASTVDPTLAEWIKAHSTFPATMVDRITPATTAEDIAWVQANLGYHDPACVLHEGFRQWVIEEDFAGDRPAWDTAGAQFVASVEAHEHMKLRCLNGTHSTLAYLGYLAGHEAIYECVSDPSFAAMCQRLWQDEIVPTLEKPDGEDLGAYCDTLLARYHDPAIRHRTWQIAMDGSQKLPQRILGTIEDNLQMGRMPHGLCLAVAGWMRYVGGVDEQGAVIDVRDPLAGHLKTISDGAEDKVAALLEVKEVFGDTLPRHDGFRTTVTAAYQDLCDMGTKAVVERYVSQA